MKLKCGTSYYVSLCHQEGHHLGQPTNLIHFVPCNYALPITCPWTDTHIHQGSLSSAQVLLLREENREFHISQCPRGQKHSTRVVLLATSPSFGKINEERSEVTWH